MKPESEWYRKEAPRPWHRDVIGENSVGEPVCVVRDADGRTVAEYLAVADADLIVAAANAPRG